MSTKSELFDELLDTLKELYDLMQGVIDGDYKPDSFTLQPARLIINKATNYLNDEKLTKQEQE